MSDNDTGGTYPDHHVHDPGVPVDADTPDGFDAESVIERWKEIEEDGCAVPPDIDQGDGDE